MKLGVKAGKAVWDFICKEQKRCLGVRMRNDWFDLFGVAILAGVLEIG